jgi:hypothetical protein
MRAKFCESASKEADRFLQQLTSQLFPSVKKADALRAEISSMVGLMQLIVTKHYSEAYMGENGRYSNVLFQDALNSRPFHSWLACASYRPSLKLRASGPRGPRVRRSCLCECVLSAVSVCVACIPLGCVASSTQGRRALLKVEAEAAEQAKKDAQSRAERHTMEAAVQAAYERRLAELQESNQAAMDMAVELELQRRLAQMTLDGAQNGGNQ